MDTQDTFYNQMLNKTIHVLVSTDALKGYKESTLLAFDKYTILIKLSDGKIKLINKSFIVSVEGLEEGALDMEEFNKVKPKKEHHKAQPSIFVKKKRTYNQ